MENTTKEAGLMDTDMERVDSKNHQDQFLMETGFKAENKDLESSSCRTSNISKDCLKIIKSKEWANSCSETETRIKGTMLVGSSMVWESTDGLMVLLMTDSLRMGRDRVEELGYLTTQKSQIFIKGSMTMIRNQGRENIHGRTGQCI